MNEIKTYTYTNARNEVIFRIVSDGADKADEEFEKVLHYKPQTNPFITCMCTFGEKSE